MKDEATTPIDFESMADDEVAGSDLERLGAMVRKQRELEKELADLDAKKKDVAKRLSTVSQESIPAFLEEHGGLSEIKLADGTKVEVQEKMTASTTGKYRDAINAWLEQTGMTDLIRNELVVEFPPSADDDADAAAQEYAESGLTTKRKRYVNAAQFAATVRELLGQGKDVPIEELGIFTYKQTKLSGGPE